MVNENMFTDLIPKQNAGANMFADLIPKQDSGFLSRLSNDASANGDVGVAAMNNPNLNPLGRAATEAYTGLDTGLDIGKEAAKSAWNALPFGITSPVENAGKFIGNRFAQNPTGAELIREAKAGGQKIGELAQEYPNTAAVLHVAGDVAPVAGGVINAAKTIPDVAEAIGKSNPIDFLKNTASGGVDVLPTPSAPVIDARTAKLVQDAQDLGINIPSRVFAPGIVSDTLTKVGLMPADTMKSDVTTALSKAMGHEGTANLDVDTVGKIQSDIGKQMDSFALKADEKGGIPVSKTELNSISDQSLADDPKVAKLSQKIQDRLDKNGNLSGSDYQALTKKGGILDRAMNSSDSEFADTAKKFRGHLDDQLEQTVNPDDLSAFQENRRQYRTLKIVQPLVESGGITGQADSASKLFNAVSRNYGSINNALKYNPQLGKIAQIVNEFPEAIKDAPKQSMLAKATTMATAPAALGIGAVGGIPAGIAAAATLPIAKGTAMYLGSAGRKSAILSKSLPEAIAPAASTIEPIFPKQLTYNPASEESILAGGRSMQPRPMTADEVAASNAMQDQNKKIGLTSDVRSAQQKAAVSGYERDNPLNNFFNKIGDKKFRINQTALNPESVDIEKNPFSKGGSVKKNLTAEFLARKYK